MIENLDDLQEDYEGFSILSSSTTNLTKSETAIDRITDNFKLENNDA